MEPEYRCKWIKPDGQCQSEAADGSPFCKIHGPVSTDQGLRHYLITNRLLGNSPDRHCAVEEIKDLRSEIALTRALIETRLNLSQSETELIASMGILHQYLTTVEKLVSSCHRMDSSLGNLLNKASILNLAQELVNIIVTELDGVPGRDEIVDKISAQILAVIGNKDNK